MRQVVEQLSEAARTDDYRAHCALLARREKREVTLDGALDCPLMIALQSSNLNEYPVEITSITFTDETTARVCFFYDGAPYQQLDGCLRSMKVVKGGAPALHEDCPQGERAKHLRDLEEHLLYMRAVLKRR